MERTDATPVISISKETTTNSQLNKLLIFFEGIVKNVLNQNYCVTRVASSFQ
jgi:hypothetical protein